MSGWAGWSISRPNRRLWPSASGTDDPIHILVVDDKPAIVEQIRAGLAATAWKVTSADQPGQALGNCMQQGVDVVLASLSLPKDGAYILFQNLREHANLATIPFFGLCVKTATAEQERAQQAGIPGIITKPIDCEALIGKVSRALRLETSYKYYQQREGVLTMTLPKEFNPVVARQVSGPLNEQLTATVDAGGNKLIIDLSAAETASIPLIEFLVSVSQACGNLSISHAIAGSETFVAACRSYEDSRSWLFANSFDKARALLK